MFWQLWFVWAFALLVSVTSINQPTVMKKRQCAQFPLLTSRTVKRRRLGIICTCWRHYYKPEKQGFFCPVRFLLSIGEPASESHFPHIPVKIIIAFKGAIWNLYNLLTAPQTDTNTYAHVDGRSRVYIMCNTLSACQCNMSCYMLRGTNGQLSY